MIYFEVYNKVLVVSIVNSTIKVQLQIVDLQPFWTNQLQIILLTYILQRIFENIKFKDE